jgi:precorrin-4/cobalt-precorrin-4 C11-methyltransferase
METLREEQVKHPVIFVGAGPGDPDLITVKGQQALQTADLIVYAGSLVPEAVMKWAPADTIRVNSAGMHLDEIIDQMTRAYHSHQRVVRLHTGDPSLYGAIFEQMAELDKRTVAYRVVPGVTAAFAAAAAMGIEYTLPEVSQTLILTRMAGRTPVPEAEALSALAAHQASLVIYLSISLVDQVQAILINAYGADAPCAVAYRVSQPDEKISITDVGDLCDLVQREQITRQALIIVGKVLGVSKNNIIYKSKLYDPKFEHGFRKSGPVDER